MESAWIRLTPERGPRMVSQKSSQKRNGGKRFENDELSWFIGMALRKNHNVREKPRTGYLEGQGQYRTSAGRLFVPTI